MPAPIDLLFRLTQRDLAFPHWGPHYNFISLTGGGSPMITTLGNWDAADPPPGGTILFLTNVMASLTPSIGETPRGLSIRVMNRNTGAIESIILSSQRGAALNAQHDVQSQVDLAVPLDRFYLDAFGVFSGGLANLMTFAWQGYVMPKGEIGFV